MGRTFDTPGTPHPDAIAIEQQPSKQQRMIGREATAVAALVPSIDGRQVQFISDIGDEATQVVFWQPVLQRRRKKKRLIEAANSKAFVHTSIIADLLRNIKYFSRFLSPTGS